MAGRFGVVLAVGAGEMTGVAGEMAVGAGEMAGVAGEMKGGC